jgi:hypothetical protein
MTNVAPLPLIQKIKEEQAQVEEPKVDGKPPPEKPKVRIESIVTEN